MSRREKGAQTAKKRGRRAQGRPIYAVADDCGAKHSSKAKKAGKTQKAGKSGTKGQKGRKWEKSARNRRKHRKMGKDAPERPKRAANVKNVHERGGVAQKKPISVGFGANKGILVKKEP